VSSIVVKDVARFLGGMSGRFGRTADRGGKQRILRITADTTLWSGEGDGVYGHKNISSWF
jgi:hypothetical protein